MKKCIKSLTCLGPCELFFFVLETFFDYYQCWKQLCCFRFLWKPWYVLFFRIHWWI